MFGNGVMIGMIAVTIRKVQQEIQQVQIRARTVCFVAVAGTAMPSIAVLLIGAATSRAIATTIWDSALPAVQSDIYFCVEL